MSPAAKAKKYPLKLLPNTPVILEADAAKQLSSKNVVETGILSLVRMRRKRGAATCRKVNSLGGFVEPFGGKALIAYIPIKQNPTYGDGDQKNSTDVSGGDD